MDGRRQVDAAGDRLEVVDVERVRVDVAVPADDVERVVVEHVVLVAAADADDQLVVARLVVRHQLLRRVEVTVRVGRVLEQLAVAVAVPVRCLDLSGRVEGQPQLVAVGPEPVGRAARDHDVVVLAVGERAERRLELTRPLVDEDHLVTLTVAIEVVLGLDRAADADLDVVVVHQHAAPEDRVAAGVDLGRVKQPVGVGGRNPLLVLDRP